MEPIEDAIVHGLQTLLLDRVQAAERTKVLFPMLNPLNAHGRYQPCIGDLKYHKAVLIEILKALQGLQPCASVYAAAVRMFDAGMGWTIGNVPTDQRNPKAGPSSFAQLEGQTLHDLISYIHKLKRSHEGTRDPDIAELKAVVGPARTRRRRREPDSASDGAGASPSEALIDSADMDTSLREHESPELAPGAASRGRADVEEVPNDEDTQAIKEHLMQCDSKLTDELAQELAYQLAKGEQIYSKGVNYDFVAQAIEISDSDDDDDNEDKAAPMKESARIPAPRMPPTVGELMDKVSHKHPVHLPGRGSEVQSATPPDINLIT